MNSETKKKVKILCVVPARGGSKGVPGKNLRPLGGMPLISYVLKMAQNVPQISTVALSTEHKMIAEIAQSFGAEVPLLRPSELSHDTATLIDAVRNVYNYYLKTGRSYDYVMSIQPTAPFITAQTIEAAIELIDDSGCDTVTSVAEITQGHPYIAKRMGSQNVITNFCEAPPGVDISSRQVRETAYFLTGGFYLRQVQFVEDLGVTGHGLGSDSRAICVSEIESTDINTELDFLYAEFLLEKGLVP